MNERKTLLGWLDESQQGRRPGIVYAGRLTEARGEDDGVLDASALTEQRGDEPVTKNRGEDLSTAGLNTRQRGDEPPATSVRGDDLSTAVRGEE
jgi:hypothetical protein